MVSAFETSRVIGYLLNHALEAEEMLLPIRQNLPGRQTGPKVVLKKQKREQEEGSVLIFFLFSGAMAGWSHSHVLSACISADGITLSTSTLLLDCDLICPERSEMVSQILRCRKGLRTCMHGWLSRIKAIDHVCWFLATP